MFRFQIELTNEPHIGHLRIALLNFLYAKKENKRFLFRINDTNQDLKKSNKDIEFLETLIAFGLEHDGVYYQSQNRKFYHQFAAKLLSESKAFSCFCTDKTLQSKRQKAVKNGKKWQYDGTCEKLSDNDVLNNESPFSIRIKAPKKPLRQVDSFENELIFKPEEIDSFVILEHDKSPSNDFANAVDDMIQGISMIIQENEDALNFAKRAYVCENLGFFEKIEHINIQSIAYKSELPTLQKLLDDGFLPQAIVNYLLNLSINSPCEIFELQEALEWFEPSMLTCKEAKFDTKTLHKINLEHILKLEPVKLAALVGFSGEDFGKIAKLYAPKNPTLSKLRAILQAIFSPKIAPKGFEKEFELLKKSVQKAPYFEDFDSFESYVLKDTSINSKKFQKPFYTLLTGLQTDPQDKSELESLYPLIKNYLKEIVR